MPASSMDTSTLAREDFTSHHVAGTTKIIDTKFTTAMKIASARPGLCFSEFHKTAKNMRLGNDTTMVITSTLNNLKKIALVKGNDSNSGFFSTSPAIDLMMAKFTGTVRQHSTTIPAYKAK
jgi:hypothetical protein